MSDQVIYSGAISADGRPIAEGGASGAGGTFSLRLAGLADIDAYIQKVLGYSPIAYYPLNEASGTTAEDLSGSTFDGTYSGAAPGGTGIGDGNTGATFDGTADLVNIAAMRTALNGDAGSISFWAKVSGAGVWSDATLRYLVRLFADSSNAIQIWKTATANQLSFQRIGDDTVKTVSSTALSGSTAYFHLALTWDVGADALKAYIGGSQVGATQTGNSAFDGVPAATTTAIGAAGTSGANSWSGQIAHVAIFDRALAGEEIADLATL